MYLSFFKRMSEKDYLFEIGNAQIFLSLFAKKIELRKGEEFQPIVKSLYL